ncbi:MAG TPA: UbiA family prenyltransferase, partial [Gemmataceae bacterium]|nr:UbiA family prenyltransferase [Gemmataceae bacterium]
MSRRVTAYARLVRLPNLFTALSDVGLGLLAAGGAVSFRSAVLIAAASSALYCGGMIWNDYFDIEQDRRERPNRPLPSGAIEPRTAARFGGILLL